jgi:ArsR family transcriptional regulator, lead/cadmium/zinc/bismuth-responsive transcriptional repressor
MTNLTSKTASHLADLFASLSDASRLRIIDALLEGERSVGEIAVRLAMSESAVSHQLQRLRVMRLVHSRKQGRNIFYTLDDEHVTRLYQMGLDHILYG